MGGGYVSPESRVIAGIADIARDRKNQNLTAETRRTAKIGKEQTEKSLPFEQG